MFRNLYDPERTKAWMAQIDGTITGFVPHSVYQAEPILDHAKTIILQCGRRTGKTVCAMYIAVQRAIELSRTPLLLPGVDPTKETFDKEKDLFNPIPGVTIQIIAPERSLAKGAIDILEQMIPNAWKDRSTHANAARTEDVEGTVGIDRRMTMRVNMLKPYGPHDVVDPTIVRPTWRIEVLSGASSISGQGMGADVTIFTEAHEIDEDTYERAFAQGMDPWRLGQQVIESIPSTNPQHWTARIWRECVRDTSGNRNAYRWTVSDNPLNTADRLQDILDAKGIDMPEDVWWRQFMAHRPSGSGGYFTFLDKTLVADVPEHDDRYSYVAGFDHGASQNSVLIVKRKEDGMTVHGMSFDPNMTDNYMLNRVVNTVHEFGVKCLYVDATGPHGKRWVSDLREEFDNDIEVVEGDMNGEGKSKLYEAYKIGMENGMTRLPVSFNTVYEQLSAIKVKEGKTRYNQFDSEGGYRDDWADAEILAFAALEKDPRNFNAAQARRDVERRDVVKKWWEHEHHPAQDGDEQDDSLRSASDLALVDQGLRSANRLRESLNVA